MEVEADYEETSRQRVKTRVSASTKLAGTNRMTRPLVNPLVVNWASMEEPRPGLWIAWVNRVSRCQ